ncbi:MAG: hypothetical protein AWU57_560 [Marinobacter sp. T13-3]|nr:MAG: hypothetical protein AWU57_560 [Marinobacter sp. T13-3]
MFTQPTNRLPERQRGATNVELLLGIGTIITVSISIAVLAFMVFGETDRPITTAARQMLHENQEQTREVDFLLASPVTLSLREPGTGRRRLASRLETLTLAHIRLSTWHSAIHNQRIQTNPL